MTRQLLIATFASLLTVTTPLTMLAVEMDSVAAEQIDSEVGISINGQAAYITGAQGETLEVVSLTGRQVMSVKIDSPNQRVELNIPKGCYILKVGKVVRKIQVH